VNKNKYESINKWHVENIRESEGKAMVIKRSNACPFDLFLVLCFFFFNSLYEHDDAAQLG